MWAGLDGADSLGMPFRVVAGGKRRQDSVFNGLNELPSRCTHVLVHDSARPFASVRMVSGIIDRLQSGDEAVIPAIDVTDTIKQVEDGIVEKTLVRSRLKAVQTPQGFALPTLYAAHKQAEEEGWDVTDDASMVEMAGKDVHICEGEEGNIKMTNPEDLKKIEDDKRTIPCVGWGYDVHKFGEGRPMVLGGVPIPGGPEVIAHSDGDVLLHAIGGCHSRAFRRVATSDTIFRILLRPVKTCPAALSLRKSWQSLKRPAWKSFMWT